MSTLLDTQSIPASDRFDYWSAGIAEHYFKMETASTSTGPFIARLAGAEVGPIAVRTIQSSPHRVERTQRMIARNDPESILLYLLKRGSARLEQAGRQCEIRPGELALQDTSCPSEVLTTTGFDLVVISFPRWFVGADADALARRSAKSLTAHQPFMSLSRDFLSGLAEASLQQELNDAEANATAEILLTTLRTFTDGEGEEPRNAPRLLTELQRYARQNLDDPALGPERLAAEHFISLRYVHKLFAAAGTSVAAWIREQRLEGAFRELSQTPDCSIAAISSKWGYRDPASFSRAFRTHHGISPTEAKRHPANTPTGPTH